MSANSESDRNKLIKLNLIRLGQPLIDVELSPDQCNAALDLALAEYRKRAGSAVEESTAFLQLHVDVDTYVLPEEIIEVRSILRAGISGMPSNGTEYDPFSLAAYNNMYFMGASRAGGLLSLEIYGSYMQLASRMFGGNYNYDYINRTHTLKLHRRPQMEEVIGLWTYNYVPEDSLFKDPYVQPWIRDWCMSEMKAMLSNLYRRAQGVMQAGPGAGQLPHAELMQESKEEKEQLIKDLRNYGDHAQPLGLFFG